MEFDQAADQAFQRQLHEERMAFDEQLHNASLALQEQLHNESLALQQSLFDQQQAVEQERRDRVKQLIIDIEAAYDGREVIYDQYKVLTYAANLDSLTKQRDDSEKQLKFSLARAGLAGGQVDSDKFTELAERYDAGILKTNNFAAAQKAALRSQDQAVKSSLVALASSGQVDSTILLGNDAALAAVAELSSNPVVNPEIEEQFAGLNELIGSALVVSPTVAGFESRVSNSSTQNVDGSIS